MPTPTDPMDYSWLWGEDPELTFANEMRWLPFWSQTGAPDTAANIEGAMGSFRGGAFYNPEAIQSQLYGVRGGAEAGNPGFIANLPGYRRTGGRGTAQNWLSGIGYQPPQSGRGTNIQDFYRNRFSDIFSQYQGQLGAQTEAHQAPNLEFRDYLQSYPFLQQFYNQAPAARGQSNRQFAPPTQFMPSF